MAPLILLYYPIRLRQRPALNADAGGVHSPCIAKPLQVEVLRLGPGVWERVVRDDLAFRVQGLGLRVEGLGFEV